MFCFMFSFYFRLVVGLIYYILCRSIVSWYCVVVLCHSIVSWYCVVILCHSIVS